jgi:hypothetical protein
MLIDFVQATAPAVEAAQHLITAAGAGTAPTAHVVAASAGNVHADGTILDTVNGLIKQAKVTFGGGATFGVMVWILISAFRHGFTLIKLLGAALAGGLCLWLVLGGVQSVSDKTGNQIDNASAVVHVTNQVPRDITAAAV